MRFLTLLAALLTASLTYAQDNIVLRNGEEIPAKVLEVNQIDLKYRKSANPEGPVYTSPLRDVLFIKYANGTKDAFGAESAKPIPKPETSGMAEPVLPATRGLNELQYHRSVFSRYFTDTNGQRIGISEIRSLLQSQPDALRFLNRGRSLRTWSVATAIPAAALIGTGVALMVFGDDRGEHGRMMTDRPDRTNDSVNDFRRGADGFDGGMKGFGGILGGSGVLLGAAAVWFDHRASVQFRRATDRYNNRHSTTVRFVPARRSLGIRAVLTF